MRTGNRVKELSIPVCETDIRSLALGDALCFTGLIYTGRLAFHRRLLDKGIIPPIPFDKSNVLLHMGGIFKRATEGWQVLTIDAHSSALFDPYGPLVMETLSPRVIIGKNTMGSATMQAMAARGCVHVTRVGVAGNLLADQVRRIVDVFYLEELGPLEATWLLEVERFGPFIVDIDAHGNNLFHRIEKQVRRNLEKACLQWHSGRNVLSPLGLNSVAG